MKFTFTENGPFAIATVDDGSGALVLWARYNDDDWLLLGGLTKQREFVSEIKPKHIKPLGEQLARLDEAWYEYVGLNYKNDLSQWLDTTIVID